LNGPAASDSSGDEELTPKAAKWLKKELTDGIKKIKEELVTLMASMMSTKLHNGPTDRTYEVLYLSGGSR